MSGQEKGPKFSKYGKSLRNTHLNAIFPFNANEIAFMNSVVLGTRANKVTPRNFSSMAEPPEEESPRMTSITSTRISK